MMLKRSYRPVLLAIAILASHAGVVRAQQYGGGDIGVKLSESNVLHVGVAAEAGYDTNVFYNDDHRTNSAVLRVIPSFLITNNGRDGKPRSELVYSFGGNLMYREYLSDQEDVRSQRAFIPSVLASLLIPGPKTVFTLTDQFTRQEDPPYLPGGSPIVRDTNQGTVGLEVSPGGGRITTSLRYTNALDYFETAEYKFASSLSHDGMLDGAWKWLPKTAIFLQLGGGYTHFLNASQDGMNAPGARESSIPLRAVAGIRGLLTSKTTVSFAGGYATAFYQNSPSPSGVSNLHVSASVGYIPSLQSRLTLALFHGFRNSSVIGTHYDLDSASLGLNYLIGRVVATGSASYEYRRYRNYVIADAMGVRAVNRSDHIVGGVLGADFYIQKWFYAGASYALSLVDPTGDAADPNRVKYTKQQVFARLGVSY